jgi:hypothetical protein
MTPRQDERIPPIRNPDWYRIRYQLAALYLNEATAGWVPPSVPEGTNAGERKGLALKETKDLATEAARNIESFAPIDRYLVEFLETTVEPALLVLLAGALLFESAAQERPDHRDEPPGTRGELITLLTATRINPWALVAYVQRDHDLAPRVLYNLACFYARSAALMESEVWMREALRQNPEINPLPEAAKWLIRAVRQTPIRERRALFNLISGDPALADLRERADLMEDVRALECEEGRAAGGKRRHS